MRFRSLSGDGGGGLSVVPGEEGDVEPHLAQRVHREVRLGLQGVRDGEHGHQHAVDGEEDGGVAELFLRLHLVLDVGRDLDEVLLPDPLPVPDKDHTTIGRFHAVVVTAAAVDIEWGRCLVAAAAAGVIVEAAPDEVGRSPGARVVDRRAGQLRRE